MLTPGYRSLGTFMITTAGTFASDWVTGLEGCLALLAQLRFLYGSGGASVKAYLQTSVDQGDSAIDIACVAFGTVSENAVLNFNGVTRSTEIIPSDGAMADDTSIDGVVGDRFRVKIVVAGTYAGSTQLVCSAIAR